MSVQLRTHRTSLIAALAASFVELACNRGISSAVPVLEDERPDSSSPRSLLHTECERGVASACTRLGDSHYFDDARANPPVRELWTRGCELGDPRACDRMATAAMLGDGGPTDATAAAGWAERGCALGHAASCTIGGSLILLRSFDEIPPDFARARELFDDACARDDGAACHHLAWMYLGAIGLEREPTRARELFERSCELGYGPGCTGLGVIAAEGRIEAPNSAAATPLYERGCKLGDPNACLHLGDLHAKREVGDAVYWWKRGCGLGEPMACSQLGRAFGDGNIVELDGEQAAAYCKRACELGYHPACFDLAYLHSLRYTAGVDASELERLVTHATIIFPLDFGWEARLGINWMADDAAEATPAGCPECERDTARAYAADARAKLENAELRAGFDLLLRVCKRGDGRGCSLAGYIELYGMIDTANPAAAAQEFVRGCELGDATACTAVGRLHARFDGVGLEHSWARHWSLRGCELGDAIACVDIGNAFLGGEFVRQDHDRAAEYLQRACELDPSTCPGSSRP